jgi:hypothetical protein
MSTYPYAAPGRAGLTFRQMPVLPSLQLRHRPQAMLNGNRAQVADLDELDVRTHFCDLAEDLVAEDQVLRRGRAAAHHVLVAAADVRGDDLENHTVVELASDVSRVDARPVLQFELGVVDLLYLDLAGLDVSDASVACHENCLLCSSSNQ